MPKCAFHPDRMAVDRCAECRADICQECRMEVAGKPVCARCVEAIRAKVAAEMDSRVTSAAPAAYGAAVAESYSMPSPIVQESPGPSRMLAGVVLGCIFGAVGAFLIKTLAYYTGFAIGYLNIAVGFAVGYGVVLGSGRRGLVPAVIGGVLALGSMMFADYLLFVAAIRDVLGDLASTISLSDFIEAQKRQGIMHWVLVAIGVYGGFSIAMAPKEQYAA